MSLNHLYILLQKYPNKPWNWYELSRNPNITFEIVEKYIDKPWDWYWLSRNPMNRVNSAKKIQRVYRKYLKRKHRKNYKYVMTEINMNPRFGYEFKVLKSEVEKLIN